MPYLDQFTEDQKELLVSLPYRTGLWVSESDEGGTENQSSEVEMAALESIIMGYSEDFLKSEFVEELMKETLNHKKRWKEWAQNLDTVPRQCRLATTVVNERMEPKDALSFRQTLMEIATAVAMAYREFDDESSAQKKLTTYAQYYWQSFMARLKNKPPPTLDEILNISKAEQKVLVKLSDALQVDLEGNPLSSPAAA